MESLPGELTRNPWIEFEDDEGIRICQPDAVWSRDDGVYVVEAKLRQNRAGYAELSGLYMPVVEALEETPVKGILACWSYRWDEGLVFLGPGAEIDIPDREIGTWLFRV